MQTQKLLDSIRLGDLKLRNRVVMASMTRARAEASSHLATDLMAEYYRQRAGAGLIITEGTWPNDESVGFVNVPGMFTKQQSDSWKKVTNSVHEHGGKIFSQRQARLHKGGSSWANLSETDKSVLERS